MRLDVVDAPARDERAIIPVLETVYRRFHEPPRQVGAPVRAIRDIAVAGDRDAWLEDEHMYAGFVFDHHSPGDEIIEGKPYMYRRLGSSSWTNGMASAVPMLASAWRLGDDAMRRHALDGIEHIIQHCINPTNGLPYTAVEHERWSNRGWWFDGLSNPGHSGYLVGQTMYSALRAWQIERRFGGIDHSDWLKIIGNVIPRLAAGRNAVGEYPFVFDEMDGSGAEYESFGGVWCLAASAYWALYFSVFLRMVAVSSQWAAMGRSVPPKTARRLSKRSTNMLPVLEPMKSLTPHTRFLSKRAKSALLSFVAP